MWIIRALALGLLIGVAPLPLLWIQSGDEFEHLALATLIGLDVGQFFSVPIALTICAWEISPWRKRPRPAPPGFVLGGITLTFGALVVALGLVVMRWLDGRPSGVGDPDGETAMAALAVLSGGAALIVGMVILAHRNAAVRRSRKVSVPAP
ncbi:hypothetical protein [Planobispora longispora]|nr:hypothetical protein [Planobispora longispora]